MEHLLLTNGTLKYFDGISSDMTTITPDQARIIEEDMGLMPGSLQDGFNIRKIDGISQMSPRSPLNGNDYFRGPGQHLPGGAPELVITSISTKSPIMLRVNVK